MQFEHVLSIRETTQKKTKIIISGFAKKLQNSILYMAKRNIIAKNTHHGFIVILLYPIINPIINVPNSKPVLPSASQTRNSTGLKICRRIVFIPTSDQRVFSQPSHYCKFLYQGFYPLQPKLPAAQV